MAEQYAAVELVDRSEMKQPVMSIRRKNSRHMRGFVFQYTPGQIESTITANYSKPKADGQVNINEQYTNTDPREYTFTLLLNEFGDYPTRRVAGTDSSEEYRLKTFSVEYAISVLESYCKPEKIAADLEGDKITPDAGWPEQPPILELFTGAISVTCYMKTVRVVRKLFANGSSKTPGACTRAEVEITVREHIDPSSTEGKLAAKALKKTDAEQKAAAANRFSAYKTGKAQGFKIGYGR